MIHVPENGGDDMTTEKTVLILGASGGIGFACADLFAENGWTCAVHAFRHTETLQTWIESHPGSLLLQGDLTLPSTAKQIVSRCEYHLGHIDSIVFCAGTAESKPFTLLTDDDFRHMYDLHVIAPVRIIRAAFDDLVQQKGSVVLFSSMWGQIGASCESHYAAAKGAVLALTKSLAKEFSPYGIRVNCVSPGLIDTPMNQMYSSDDLREIIDHTPAGRIGTAREAASCALFLCSPDASYMNGQILSPSGGYIL